MNMTLADKRKEEQKWLQERREKEKEELKIDLVSKMNNESIKVLSISEDDYDYKVNVEFTIDGFTQNECFYWISSESQEDFIKKVKRHIDYIVELRDQYPDYCKKNDYIQTHRDFNKKIKLTHMGYSKVFEVNLQLADYLKLPNQTSCSFGGGDYEIKRTPKRVEEYNKNIDVAIDALLDCIAELKQKKYVEQ